MLGFPFIFRGALDVRATGINEEMKIAAAHALAELAREPVPGGSRGGLWRASHSFGRDYIIPAPFDPRLMEVVPAAVAKAAMDRRRAKADRATCDAYRQALRARLNPTASVLSLAYEAARANPKRVLFAEGEEDNVLRAAIAFKEGGYGTPVLVGREDVHDRLQRAGGRRPARLRGAQQPQFAAGRPRGRLSLRKLQRRGILRREFERMVNQDRNTFAAAARAGRGRCDDHRHHAPVQPDDAPDRPVIDDERGATPFGIHMVVGRNHTVFIADTTVNERPTAEQVRRSRCARRPSPGGWGRSRASRSSAIRLSATRRAGLDKIRDAVKVLDTLQTGFEYEGEMGAGRGAQPREQRQILSVQPPVGAGQHAGHARPPVGQYLVQAAARAGRRNRARAVADGHGDAGADRADDRQRADLVTLAVLASGGADAIRQAPERQA